MRFRIAISVALGCLAALAAGQSSRPQPAQFLAWYKTRSLPLFHVHGGPSVSWQEMGPGMILRGWNDTLNAGRMTSIVVSPQDSNLLFATAASGGIWRSDNGGSSWSPVADFAPSLSYGTIAIDPHNPNIIYAGQGEQNNSADSFAGSGLMRSEDNGIHWELLAQKVFSGQRFSRIIGNPQVSGMIYAATTRGVMRSTDHGQTWVTLLPGDATDVAINPQSPNQLLAAIGFAHGSPENGMHLQKHMSGIMDQVLKGNIKFGKR